jgi:hypothetical protein
MNSYCIGIGHHCGHHHRHHQIALEDLGEFVQLVHVLGLGPTKRLQMVLQPLQDK